jgi:urease subunit alpha
MTSTVVNGPTAGDLIELADTGLVIRVEADAQQAGDEFRTGFGKTARDGMHLRAATASQTCDVVVTNVTLLDPVTGIRTVSIGVREGRISAIGRAGNPDTLDGVDVVVGTGSTIVPGDGLLATPGAVDTHVHLLSPRVLEAALSSGVTTVIGQEIGPVWGVGLNSPWLLRRAFGAFDQWPVNVGFLARGSSSHPGPLVEGLAAGGACGFKVHEDLGAHPRCLDTALRVADEYDVQVALTPTGLTRPAAWTTRSRWPEAGCSTPSTSRAAAAGTRRTCSNWPAARTSSRPRPTRRCRSAGTRWPSTWT